MYHIKIALRTLLKGRMYTFINVLGLTLGLGVSMLIASVVIDELSYDKHWSRADRIYRLISVDQRAGNLHERKNGAVYAGLAPQLKQNFAEVEEYSTLYVKPIDLKFNKGDNQSVNVTALYTDSAVRQLLDIQITASDNMTPTKGVNKIIISEKIAKTYFNGENIIGKTIYDMPPYEDKPNEYLIVGIMKDLPANTHLRADIIMLQSRKIQELHKDGSGFYVRHYILLKPGVDASQFEKKINHWYKSYITQTNNPTEYELQSIKDSYLRSDFGAYQIIKGNMQHVYIFSGIALLILLIGCINFINLSTARASSRLKEMGVRKVLGASRTHLIRQFLLETFFVFGLASIFAFILYQVGLPWVEKFIDHPLAETSTSGLRYHATIILSVLGISLLSGVYPAWFIASFSVDDSLNKSLKTNKSSKSYLRSALVSTQFCLSILVLIAMLVVHGQVDYMKNQDIGIETEGLVSVGHISFDGRSAAFKEKLSQNPDITSLSLSSWLPADGAGNMASYIDDPKRPGEKIEIWYITGEPNLAETLGLQLQKGRFLSDSLVTDAIEADDLSAETDAIRPCIMTASTARLLDSPPLNASIKEKKQLMPVGIVKDFNSESLHKPMVPTVIVGYLNPSYGAMLVKTIPNKEVAVMRYITQVWKEFYPDKLLDIASVKETLAAQYKSEEKMEKLFTGFSVLTLLLAALGLFGLIVNSVSLRVKEIGIRKVLGASVSNITAMLSKDFVKLVLIAILIASPIACWAMNTWLEDFAYRIEIQWWMFVLAGVVALFIAIATVSWQAVRAARTNPVDSLRDE